ncbi:hypothetical protein [Atlantibacter sp.]|uniref:hypothetical protein n=1 Tax=Atlantibacter sp. TaxID=1903473 RepID=UPI0028AFA662|nr:hypothetical protein [Atlantibacter sp.]
MQGTSWRDVNDNGKNFDLKHLHPFSFQTTMNGSIVIISVAFSHHCFTDKKGNGQPLISGRYFCEARYQCSLNLPRLLQEHLVNGYIVPHFDKSSNELYYYAAIHDYAVFFDLRPDANNPCGLMLFVTSAYERDQWGKDTMPKGKPVKFSYIGHLRLNGQTYLPRRK